MREIRRDLYDPGKELRAALAELRAYHAARPESRLREYLSGQEPLLRWASAIALARLGLADPDVLGALAAASEEPPLPGTGPPVHFLDGNLRGHAAQALAALDGHLPADVIDGVLLGLARSKHVAAFPMTWRRVNFKEILRNWGLPAEQADCRAYAGLDSAQ